jgi:hypothetical protein
MDSSTKRKVGAIALIVAGIGAFLVPFLLHGPALQASNNGGGNTNGNNNNGGTTPTGSCTTNCNPTPTCTTNCSPDTTPPGCTPSTSTKGHSDDDNEGKHLAKGHDKQDKQDTSLVAKAHGFMAALGKHNPQHDATHSTKTDNDTANTHGHHANSHHTEDTSTCADNKDNESSDDEGNDD